MAQNLLLHIDGRRVDVLDGRGRRLLRVELSQVLWLTDAEQAVLGRGPLDGGAGIGAVLMPLLAHAARLDAAQPDSARPDHAQPDSARPDHAQPDSARPDHAQLDGAQPDGLERRQVAAIIRDLLSAAAAERLDTDTTAAPQQRLVVRALQIIHSRIDEPSLTSASVAAALGVSLRSLQSAFRASSASVTAAIRALRLERADLAAAAPRRAPRPTTRSAAGVDLALRWPSSAAGAGGREKGTR